MACEIANALLDVKAHRHYRKDSKAPTGLSPAELADVHTVLDYLVTKYDLEREGDTKQRTGRARG